MKRDHPTVSRFPALPPTGPPPIYPHPLTSPHLYAPQGPVSPVEALRARRTGPAALIWYNFCISFPHSRPTIHILSLCLWVVSEWGERSSTGRPIEPTTSDRKWIISLQSQPWAKWMAWGGSDKEEWRKEGRRANHPINIIFYHIRRAATDRLGFYELRDCVNPTDPTRCALCKWYIMCWSEAGTFSRLWLSPVPPLLL